MSEPMTPHRPVPRDRSGAAPQQTGAASQQPAPPSDPGGAVANGALTLRPRGLWLVTSLELRQRIRSKRWYVALGVWTVALMGIGIIILGPTALSTTWETTAQISRIVFSLQALLVMLCMLLVLPALSAGSINGDRSAGTLATLQASLLSPLEITLGKLLAGWLTGLAFLLLAMPSLLPTGLLGGVGPFYLLRVMLIIAVLALCVTAVGLGLSAITSRQLGSVVLAYVLVFGVTVVGPILWGASAALTLQDRQVTVYETDYSGYDWESHEGGICRKSTVERTVARLDLTQPLIWPNPVVLLADVAPPVDLRDPWSDGSRVDVLQLMQLGLRAGTNPLHPSYFNSCSPENEGYPEDLGSPTNRPIWPLGLGIWLGTGLGAVALTTWRLAVPIHKLGRGTRIA